MGVAVAILPVLDHRRHVGAASEGVGLRKPWVRIEFGGGVVAQIVLQRGSPGAAGDRRGVAFAIPGGIEVERGADLRRWAVETAEVVPERAVGRGGGGGRRGEVCEVNGRIE